MSFHEKKLDMKQNCKQTNYFDRKKPKNNYFENEQKEQNIQSLCHFVSSLESFIDKKQPINHRSLIQFRSPQTSFIEKKTIENWNKFDNLILSDSVSLNQKSKNNAFCLIEKPSKNLSLKKQNSTNNLFEKNQNQFSNFRYVYFLFFTEVIFKNDVFFIFEISFNILFDCSFEIYYLVFLVGTFLMVIVYTNFYFFFI